LLAFLVILLAVILFAGQSFSTGVTSRSLTNFSLYGLCTLLLFHSSLFP